MRSHLRLLSNAQAGSTIKRQLILLLTWIRLATLRTPTKESKTWKGRNMPTRTWRLSSKTSHLVKLYVSTVLSILISWPMALPNSSLTRDYQWKNQHCLARSRGVIQLTSGTTRHSVAMAEVQNTTTLKSAKKTRWSIGKPCRNQFGVKLLRWAKAWWQKVSPITSET